MATGESWLAAPLIHENTFDLNVLWGGSLPWHNLVSDSANPHYMSDPLPQSFVGSSYPPRFVLAKPLSKL